MSGGDPWHDHLHEDTTERQGDEGVAAAIWAVDNVELTTVGIDVGSATSHLMFARLHLQRRAHGYSSRFVVVERRPLYRSPVWLTPYEADDRIDARVLHEHFTAAYAEAGLGRDEVDAGAVILTGVALERQNARRIAELFADEGGRFVCASAGHNLEALLAAHGSGSVVRSAGGETVLNVDVGGGTTKFALCRAGQIMATAAIWGGARLLVLDEDGRVVRVESPMKPMADGLGLEIEPGGRINRSEQEALADAIAERIVGVIAGEPLNELPLAGELPMPARPDRVVFSGGVAEFMNETGTIDGLGDLGVAIAAAIRRRIDALGVPFETAGESIRATVIGASQFSLQLSGNTIHLSGPIQLPVHNVPVVVVRLDGAMENASPASLTDTIRRRVAQLDLADRDEPVAVVISWDGDPRYQTLRTIAEGVVTAHRSSPRRDAPLMLVLDADIGASLGSIIRDELGVSSGVVTIDGVELSDLDYIDIGERIMPANVVPVVIKSLIFPHDAAERPRMLGSV